MCLLHFLEVHILYVISSLSLGRSSCIALSLLLTRITYNNKIKEMEDFTTDED